MREHRNNHFWVLFSSGFCFQIFESSQATHHCLGLHNQPMLAIVKYFAANLYYLKHAQSVLRAMTKTESVYSLGINGLSYISKCENYFQAKILGIDCWGIVDAQLSATQSKFSVRLKRLSNAGGYGHPPYPYILNKVGHCKQQTYSIHHCLDFQRRICAHLFQQKQMAIE